MLNPNISIPFLTTLQRELAQLKQLENKINSK